MLILELPRYARIPPPPFTPHPRHSPTETPATASTPFPATSFFHLHQSVVLPPSLFCSAFPKFHSARCQLSFGLQVLALLCQWAC